MTTARFTYQRLVELVDNDHELIAQLVEEGVVEHPIADRDDRRDADRVDDRVLVDIDSVLAARTLRELEVDWSGIAIILRLRGELAEARRRIAELEAALSLATPASTSTGDR
jgi:uncharacterized protein with PhoU and TrkA domain